MSLSYVVHKSLVRNHVVFSLTKRSMTVVGNLPNAVVYEGPFAMLTTRLKAVSISSTLIGVIGLPILLQIYGSGVPQLGQYAIVGTTVLAALGSTGAVNFCFAPYVHTLEMVPVRKCHAKIESENEIECRPAQHHLVKATWRNFLLMKKEIVFDPAVDTSEYKGYRPFCNFIAKDVPLYIHAELLLDDKLRQQLLGQKEGKLYNMPAQQVRKNDEDELF